MKKFIKVFNKDDKLKLIEAGYQLISEDESTATFLNDGKFNFNKSDVKNFVYTSLLTFQD